MTEPIRPSPRPRHALSETGVSLAWLADAPLFIDGMQVSAFYDAVVRPEGRQGKTVISLQRYEGQTTALKGAVEGEVSVSKLITTLLPFLDVKAKASAGGEHERAHSETRGETIELHPIETPQRQLVQLTLHYLTNLPRRTLMVTDPKSPSWHDQEFISALPRALAFLDFSARTQFIPMAAEVADGHVVKIFNQLKGEGEAEHHYPERTDFDTEEAYAGALRDYWHWFEVNFSSFNAMEMVEEVIASGGGRVQWIAYRVPLPGQRPLHLHISGRGKFDTGVFAYNLIKRGFKHGLRMVGTLKSEPDMNVLAIFEK